MKRRGCAHKISVPCSFNPIALRKAKIVYNFGLSECNRVNYCPFQYGTPWLSDAKIKSYGMDLYTYVVLKHRSFLLKHY